MTIHSLNIIFMGSPAFSVPALHALHTAGHKIIHVYSQPPKPSGRGHKIQPTPVHAAAEALGIPVRTPRTLRSSDEQEFFTSLKADVAVVVAYGLILPRPILDAPRMGCINIHASLLPRWRGAAPIQRAILAGDTKTGITTMQMEEGLDTGPMLMWEKTPITASTTTPQLHDVLADMGANLIVKTLAGLQTGEISPTPQPTEGVTYAAKLTKEDGRIDWHKPATEIHRMIRALSPWPGCFFEWPNIHGQTENIKVISAEISPMQGHAGKILSSDGAIGCGEGSLKLIKVQRPNHSPTSAEEWLRINSHV